VGRIARGIKYALMSISVVGKSVLYQHWMLVWRRGSRASARRIEALDDAVRYALAACACEGKDVAEKRVDVVGERFLEQPSGAVEPCFHGFRTKAQEIGGFLDAHVLDHSSHKDRAKLVGQVVDGAFEELAELALGHGALRVRGLVAGQGEGNDLGVNIVATEPTRYVSWPKSKLKDFMSKNPELHSALKSTLAIDLTRKLQATLARGTSQDVTRIDPV
jgi:CRP-like cAMP-binding protein